ncbi:MAG TPA: methyl viologen-reducing hydrogenase [Desulfobulbaceae bacterium]|nr:methyl viologen-reducing hydrogenase [Desulfobulbaceae bacterium]
MGVRIAEEWLHSCSGCEISILNIGEPLIELLEKIDFVHIPVLIDNKYYGQLGDGKELRIPEADVGIVSGGVANQEHLEVLFEMRKKCKVLIALGTCATHGGLPALINEWGMKKGIDDYYKTPTTEPCEVPSEVVPKPLDRVYAVDEKVKVDLMLPGCPPNPALIAEVVNALLEGRDPAIPGKSVCDTCPTRREGKGGVSRVRRFLQNAQYDPEAPIDEMRCLLEQGLMCMGPVTAAGCAAGRGVPSCIRARVPCRGCFGPVRKKGNQMLDMMNALASNGIDWKSVVDRRSLLRFSGAHGLLKPLSARKGEE